MRGAEEKEVKGKQQNEKIDEEDVWSVIKRTANRKCKSADAPAVMFGLLLQWNQSRMNSSYNNFQVSASENSPFTLTECSHCFNGSVFGE